MSSKSDISRDEWMLTGDLARKGYDWWWHSFTGINDKTGEEKTFYIEFFTCNPGRFMGKPMIVWNDPEKRSIGLRPSYLMVNVGHWGKRHAQLHRFFAWKDVDIWPKAPFLLKAGDCLLSETHTKGSVSVSAEEAKAHPEMMTDAGNMSWDLDIDKLIAFNVGYGAAKPFRQLNAFEMFWHAEGMKTAFRGHVTLDGETYTVSPETCYGYSDKNWGSDFTSPWVWLASNNLVSTLTGRRLMNSAFDIGGGRPKALGIAMDRKLLGEFYYEGEDFEFNFSKFWTMSETKFKCAETEDEIRWHVLQTTRTAKLETKVVCKKSDMLLINYESPDGMKRHNRLWNGGNGKGILKLYRRTPAGAEELVDIVKARNVGCEYGEYES